ncbi:MAG: divalent cation tolerance protein CutA [Candidatus Lokiarchaeota archaeon]|nr:divalent cation tolerance protein CutA [Candidatus Lokiarchaeota archaeon]
MNNYKLAMTTCSTNESHDLAKTIVESKKAACVNVVEDVFSIYHWQGEMETARESILIMKTTANLISDLQSIVEQAHSYDVPEFVVLPIEQGADRYLKWISDVVK